MEVRQVQTQQELDHAFQIREDVFVREQKVPIEDEFDEYDKEALHVLAVYQKSAAGTGRMRIIENTVKLERICILASYRKYGIGKAIITALENIACDHGCKSVKLHGQVQAAGFYQKLGYQTASEEFIEDGIPHYLMIKDL
ncbi:GNAT family N-acetyltransferase [Halobacillus sp. Marseille-Q1614]|uniref:GNAT family N-acetyltransferase n=1 Tax=Halobacillus sp. Marseille-Q1614 TaxID=2709134 RepID=UPI00156F7846|nr:GNAT family N-acetyltransferase [Halobacillus sp. Marseille-Q1614]